MWPLLPTSVQKANNFKYELQSFYLYKVHESRRCVTKIVGHCFYFRGPIVDLQPPSHLKSAFLLLHRALHSASLSMQEQNAYA